jgi:hypothetical protein
MKFEKLVVAVVYIVAVLLSYFVFMALAPDDGVAGHHFPWSVQSLWEGTSQSSLGVPSSAKRVSVHPQR